MYELFDSLLIIGAGYFAWLAATGQVKVSRSEEQGRLWREKYGKLLKILAPVIVMLGVFQLFQSSYGFP